MMGEVRLDTAKAARFSASALSTDAFDALPLPQSTIYRCPRRPKRRSSPEIQPESRVECGGVRALHQLDHRSRESIREVTRAPFQNCGIGGLAVGMRLLLAVAVEDRLGRQGRPSFPV